MKTGAALKYSAIKFLLPAIVLLGTPVAGSAISVKTLELTLNDGLGLYAYLFLHSESAPFQLPEPLVKKGQFSALDLGGQSAIPIAGIKGIHSVSDVVLINGVNARKELLADVAIGYEIDSLEVYSDASAGALAQYGSDPIGGVVGLTTKRVPIGSNLSGDQLRPAGTYNDFSPYFSKETSPLRAVWAYGTGFTAEAVGVVTEDTAFRVIELGDPVPERPVPPPIGTGTTFTELNAEALAVSGSYVLYQGEGDFFFGLYTERFSDGAKFAVTESFTLDPATIIGAGTPFFHGEKEVVFTGTGGIYWGDAEGATPPEIILANDTEYEPGKTFITGGLTHVSGDLAVIAGRGDASNLNTLFLLNLMDFSVQQIVQEGEEIPDGNGETFGFVPRAGVSDDMVVFEGYDEFFQFVGLFARMLDTWELKTIVRVGETFDGGEVQGVSFFPDAVEDNVVGFTVYYTDGLSGAYLTAPDIDFTVPFGNISTRAQVMTGDNVLIGGFISAEIPPPPPPVNRTAALTVGKQVIVRAIGPSLGEFGVEGPLADPTLELHMPDGSVLTNDNWRETQEQEIMESGLAPNDDLESAIVATIEPGAYTAIVSGSNGGTGVGLVEIYDLEGAAVSELANISTRGFVQTGEDVMIGGIIVGGTSSTASTMVVRAIGPSLAGFGVADPLQDPLLELHDGSGALLASNDNWKETQQTELEAAGLAPTDDRESALQLPLGPGLYTAVVRGAGDTSGVALVEAYNLEAGGTGVTR